MIAICYSNMGQAYADLKDYDKAVPYVRKGINLVKETGKDDISGHNILSKMILSAPDEVLRKNGIPASQRFQKAIEYAQISLKLAREAETLNNQFYACLPLYHWSFIICITGIRMLPGWRKLR
ncbi:MAG: tetratricopeptide repeat protein [Chitinophagaceae bacterium]